MPDHTMSHLIILVSLCLLIPRFCRELYGNQITEIINGAFTGLTALTELYDPRPRWHVPSLVSVASVSPTSLSLAALLSLYLLAIPLFMYTHDHTLYVPIDPLPDPPPLPLPQPSSTVPPLAKFPPLSL